jgi:hypothetical protein
MNRHPIYEESHSELDDKGEYAMRTWNVFDRNKTIGIRCVVMAATKAEAEQLAFVKFNRVMDVDLDRQEKM